MLRWPHGKDIFDLYGANVMDRKQIILFCIGNSCEDFSQYSNQHGLAGLRMTDYQCVVAEIRAIKPDQICLENNKAFPSAVLIKDLGDLYGVVRFVSEPQRFGFPGHRARSYFILWLKSKWMFIGNENEFNLIFEEEPVLDADDFLLAPEQERSEMMLRMAAKKSNIYKSGTHFSQIPLEQVFWPGTLAIKEDYAKLQSTGCNLKGTYVCDLDQNCGWSSSGSWLPCLVTHGKLFSISKGCVFTPKEHMLAMGEAVYEEAQTQGASCLFQAFLDSGGLDSNTIKHMAGQAMHLQYLSPFVLYAVANLIRKFEGDEGFGT